LDPLRVRCNVCSSPIKLGRDKSQAAICVTYALWSEPCYYVCLKRARFWNEVGRFRDSAPWIEVYTYLLSRYPQLQPLRKLFRKWARFLMWPRYEEVKSQEDSQKALDNRRETDT